MEPIGNEPRGWGENQQSHTTNFGGQSHKEKKTTELDIDTSNSSMAGIAKANMLDDEEVEIPPTVTDDPRGFMGDFAEPQHDED